MWGWAKGYIASLGWAIAPVWMPASAVSGAEAAGIHGCCCKDGEACTTWGKHLVSGLGVAREVDDVESVWPVTDVRVRNGWIGLAVLTGSESKIVVLDVGDPSAARLTQARFKITGHVLTQETPSHGEHWFFSLNEDEAVTGGRSEIELVTGVWVLGDGAFAVLGPRRGYHWTGGGKVLTATEGGITEATDALRMRLGREGLLHGVKDVHPDAPWRTRPGTPLVGGAPRTYTRRGDIRRLVDTHGDRMLFTPGLGWRVWTESGWGGRERSETAIKSYVMDLPDVCLGEAAELRKRKEDTLSKSAVKWATRIQQRSTSSVMGDLESDERVLVPSANDWDAEGWIAGLPVLAGVGRLIDLATGGIVLDARTRRVSKSLGATYEDGPGGTFKHLWDRGCEGREGRWFVKYITDLEDQMGDEAIRLLQRAAGASLYGRRGVHGDTDAVFVLKGPARSGKSTFSEMLLRVAGGYGKALNANVLFDARGNPEFSDAALYGFRVLALSEPPMHATLNTTKLKQLSGGDSITGRLPFGKEEISFVPECSIWLSTNHALEVADEALWRRMKFFKFRHSWEGAAELPELRAALTSDPDELKLALAWMLQGAIAWWTDGWGDVSAWTATNAEERTAHDPIMKWITSCVEYTGVPTDSFTYADLTTSFNWWITTEGDDVPKMSKAALRDECVGACVRMGMVLDGKGSRVYGGLLR